eukprot:676338-Pelagomonas_calceolata.AAC.1
MQHVRLRWRRLLHAGLLPCCVVCAGLRWRGTRGARGRGRAGGGGRRQAPFASGRAVAVVTAAVGAVVSKPLFYSDAGRAGAICRLRCCCAARFRLSVLLLLCRRRCLPELVHCHHLILLGINTAEQSTHTLWSSRHVPRELACDQSLICFEVCGMCNAAKAKAPADARSEGGEEQWDAPRQPEVDFMP